MARPGRVERPTFGSVDQRSIQLSYGRVMGIITQKPLPVIGELQGQGEVRGAQVRDDFLEVVLLRG